MTAEPRSYRLSPLAEDDLEQIWTYTAQTWSLAQADRYVTDIVDVATGLANGDRIGRDASDLRAGYFKYAVGRHLLFYQMGGEHLEIIRILHQRMDVDAHLDEP